MRLLLPRSVWLLPVLALCFSAKLAAAEALSEYEVKAGFLFNFSRFVQWPEKALPRPNQPLVIGILGADPFGQTLDELVRGEDIMGRSLIVRRFTNKDDFTKCHILFISKSETSHLAGILARLKGLPVLTVGDCDRFADSGGTIGLVMEGGRVHLHINVGEAKTAQLALSAKLLRPATLLNEPQSLLIPRLPMMQYVSGGIAETIIRRALSV